MKVYANNTIINNGISRIADNIKKYAPKGIEFVDRERDADFVIIYAYGQRRKVEKRIKWIGERGQKYAMFQIAVRSTANPNTNDWLPMWDKAKVVWSYYNLAKLLEEDGHVSGFPFYYAPLGVDTTVFKDYHLRRNIQIVVGDSRDESVNEVIRAAKGNVFNLGAGISDKELAKVYSSAHYVSGLRRKEGFEMPVLEGLMCGARPICYDRPHYEQWFDDHVEYIPEGSSEEVIKNLQEIFSKPVRPVTDAEKAYIKRTFDWKKLVAGFWEQICL